MSDTENFKKFIDNIKIDNLDLIAQRYKGVTKRLNKDFRDTDSDEANSRRIGSMGRFTAIKGISDLDMAYFIPTSSRNSYKAKLPKDLLYEVRDSIKKTYSTSTVKADGQIVSITFSSHVIEVLPCFKMADGSLEYPDTNDGGSWKITKPLDEIQIFTEFDADTNGNLRHLCRMVRAWRNEVGLQMGGLLIDTLAYKFLKEKTEYQSNGYSKYGLMLKSFFAFIGSIPKEQEVVKAPGSNQNVKIKTPFQAKAKKAAKRCQEAVGEENAGKRAKIWRNILGRNFPLPETIKKASLLEHSGLNQTEEFIEDYHPVDIRYNLQIDCDVSQNGFRGDSLRGMLNRAIPLLAKKKLSFRITGHSIPVDFSLKWKVLNKGPEAIKRNQIRGQILRDNGNGRKEEKTSFKGEHLVEAYALVDNVCVARSRITVPITNNI